MVAITIMLFSATLFIIDTQNSYADSNIASGTCGTCQWVIDSDGVLTIHEGTLDDYGGSDYSAPWCNYDFEYVRTDGEVVLTKGGLTFYRCDKLIEADLSGFETSNVTDMSNMFLGCSTLVSLDLSGFDTSRVTQMDSMFQDCRQLESVVLSSFDTSKVETMYRMFYNCFSLQELNLNHFNTQNVTTMTDMFSSCRSLTMLKIDNFDTSKVISMEGMFAVCHSLTNLDVSSFDTSKVSYMYGMFSNCRSLTELDITHFDTSKVYGANMACMFGGCTKLTSLDVSNIETSSATDLGGMFCECSSLKSLDVSNFDTSNVTRMTKMFSECSSLTSLDLSSFDTSKVTDFTCMFENSPSLQVLNLSGFNTSRASSMYHMFNECDNLRYLSLGTWNTDNVRYDSYRAFFPVNMYDEIDKKKYNAQEPIPNVVGHSFVVIGNTGTMALTKEDLFKGYTKYLTNHAYSKMLSTIYTDEYDTIWGRDATLTISALKKVLSAGGSGSIRILLEKYGLHGDSDKMREQIALECILAIQNEESSQADFMEGLKDNYKYLKLMNKTTTNYLKLSKDISEASGDMYSAQETAEMIKFAQKSKTPFKIADVTFDAIQATLVCMATMQAHRDVVNTLDEYASSYSDLHKGLRIIETKLDKRMSTNIVETMFKEDVYSFVSSEVANWCLNLGDFSGPLTFFVESGYKAVGKLIKGADADEINRAAMAYSNALQLAGCHLSKALECTNNYNNKEGKSVEKLMGQYAILYTGELESLKQAYEYCQAITNEYNQDAKAVLDADYAKYGPLLTYDKYIESCLRSANIDYRYKLLENGDLRILGIDNEDVIFVDGNNVINIPAEIDGHKVTEIGANAFADNAKLSCVSVPASVKSIDEGAFSDCSNLDTVFMDESVEEIGCEAFAGCDNLRVVEIPESVVTISEDAFSGAEDVVIKTPTGSAGETCANDNNIDTMTTSSAVVGIEVKSEPSKTVYLITEDLNEDGLLVEATFGDGTVKDVTDEVICTLGKKEIGNNTVLVSYEGCETSFDITIKNTECEYTVLCVDSEGNEIDTSLGTGQFGEEVYVEAPDVDGYTALESSKVLTIDVDSEVVFVYSEGSYKIIGDAEVNLGEIPEATGKQIKPEVSVELSGIRLVEGMDYEIDYGENIDAGENEGIISVNGIGDYIGSKIVMFNIKAHQHTWKHIKNAAGLLKNGNEYDQCTVCGEIQNNKAIPGYSTYYVKSFKVAKGKKSFTAKWKKQSKKNLKKFNGYQIRYATKPDMTDAKTATAGKKSKSKKIKKLAKKTKYYVQVRTYTVKNGETYYSKWSPKKSVKTK